MSDPRKESKKWRFEIFKRDGFRCIYCGATALQSPLQVDHVVPIIEGGEDAAHNLATACRDCNLGKSGTPLERKALPRPIATVAEEDHADQIREYLALQREIAAAKAEAQNEWAAIWEENIGPMTQQMYDRIPRLLLEWPAEKLAEALSITARRWGAPEKEFKASDAIRQQKYFHAILRNWRGG